MKTFIPPESSLQRWKNMLFNNGTTSKPRRNNNTHRGILFNNGSSRSVHTISGMIATPSQRTFFMFLWLIAASVIVSMLHYRRYIPNDPLFCTTCYLFTTTKSITTSVIEKRDRSIISFDEFFYRGPSIGEINRFFSFDDEMNVKIFYGNRNNDDNESTFAIRPLKWTSTIDRYDDRSEPTADTEISQQQRHNQNGTKLVFVHTARNAGWTIRSLLHTYAYQHRKSLLSIQRCMDLNYDSMNHTDTWSNGRYSRIHTANMDCIGTFHNYHHTNATTTINDRNSHNDTNDEMNNNQQLIVNHISSHYLMKHSVDVLSGQVPLGCDEYWFVDEDDDDDDIRNTNNYRRRVPTQYVVFFRHPFHQFVSEFISRKVDIAAVNKNNTIYIDDETVIQMIRSIIHKANKAHIYYEPVSSHVLITPKQMSYIERIPNVLLSNERRMNISKMNLLQYTMNRNILIGILERIDDSMNLLKYLIDPRNQSSSLFLHYTNKWASSIDSRTNTIVQKIRHNKEYIVLCSMIEEYIKYENQIYNLAIQIHDQQYKWYTEKSEN